MSTPVQQHYLPKQAYLSFFESPRKPGYIYQYQRGKDPVVVSIKKVAKERHLYTHPKVETALAALEAAAQPILARLNGLEDGPVVNISGADEATLAQFVAYQASRTPAQRQMLADLHAGAFKLTMQLQAGNPKAFAARVEQMKKAADGSLPDIDPERLRRVILEGKYDIELSGHGLMLDALRLAERIFPIICMKQLAVLKVGPDDSFLTSDHPVALVRRPETPPFWGTGFLMSEIAFPIGRKAVLWWVNEDRKPQAKGPDDTVRVYVHTIPPAQARAVNSYTIGHAESYVFSCENNPNVKKIFDETTRPERVQMQLPFHVAGERKSRGIIIARHK